MKDMKKLNLLMVTTYFVAFNPNAPIATKVVCFLVCWNVKEASMANSVDPDQTAPIGAVCSGSTLFASILSSSVM